MEYFTADLHFLHRAIIGYCGRPFKNYNEMHDTLIINWNATVKPEDTVYVVGDFAMSRNADKVESIIQQLNGKKILILGNHDYLKPFTYIDIGFWSVHTSLSMKMRTTYLPSTYDVVLNHDPAVKCIIPDDSIFIHGHIHNLYKSIPEKRVVCVSVENWGYKPVTFQQIVDEINQPGIILLPNGEEL